jgi:20S proteasome alpha/beta subunit
VRIPRRVVTLAAILFAPACALFPLIAAGQGATDDGVVHGTINIALGNQNGLVVLTDSMLTGDGHQLRQPGQKLFKLDDRTVCAFAGFNAAPAGGGVDLYTRTSAIIHEYIGQSARQPAQSISERMRALGFLLSRNLSAIANVRDALDQPTPLDRYDFQLIVAGYDLDNKLKIGRLTLATKNENGGFISGLEEASLTEVHEDLASQLNGMSDKAKELLQTPELKPDDTVLRDYAASLRANGGRSLTLDQLMELAKRLKIYTEQKYREVGGDNQIAVFRKQDAVTIEQQPFPEPPKPLVNFSLLVKSSFSYSTIGFAKGFPVIFVRCSWTGMQRELDGNYFIDNEFRDSVLTYDGGVVNLGESNRVINSKLIVGPDVKLGDKTLKQLRTAFPWSQVLFKVPAMGSWKGVPYPIPTVYSTAPSNP